MIPKEAIEKAIEGGWGGFAHFEMFSPVSPTKWSDVYVTARAMFLDFCAAVWAAETDIFWTEMNL